MEQPTQFVIFLLEPLIRCRVFLHCGELVAQKSVIVGECAMSREVAAILDGKSRSRRRVPNAADDRLCCDPQLSSDHGVEEKDHHYKKRSGKKPTAGLPASLTGE